MEIKRLTIKNGEIGFYNKICNKCSNKNDPKIRKQIEDGKRYCDVKGYKYHQYSPEELKEIYKKLSLLEDIMEKHLIETPEMFDIRLSENRNVNKMFESKISDLEAKLAESEKAIKYLKGIKRYDIGEMLTENAKLKQKLAESEENLKLEEENSEMWFCWKEIYFKELQQAKQQLAEKDKEHKKAMRTSLNDFLTLEVEFKEKKISFAVEQLEKVREFNIQQVFSSKPLDNFIDNQIKSLKEGK